ncbi:MAG: putative serine/threonine protein phosphatase [Watsoniomyces obsoletus]|nr:MAG: putative serine/threonine protein phosphatase [Watsoniomyces obsoletus]
MSRPEETLPADLYYSPAEAHKYTTSSRIRSIQTQMTLRAISLLGLTSPSYILDIGCGTCLSGSILSSIPPSEGGPHTWVGMDISSAMLSAALERDDPNTYSYAPDDQEDDDDHDDDEDATMDDTTTTTQIIPTQGKIQGDLLLSDIGHGIPFRPGTFDGAISISAIQWLCNADTTSSSPVQRLNRFFSTLYSSLRRGSRAVCQFYPRDEVQRNMISNAAIKAGFGAGILEDDPGTKNTKLFLCLTVGGGMLQDITGVVEGLEGNVDVLDSRKRKGKGGKGGMGARGEKNGKKGSKAWILRKKEQMERKGMVVKNSSKYTGRKRGPKF